MKTINRLVLCLALSFLIFPVLTIAADINQIDTNIQEQIRQQERQRLLRQQQELKPNARDFGEHIKGLAPVATLLKGEN
ncbi:MULTISPECIES: hypothetical protein [Methylotenera]|uniref:hypothetical protein n=1 Tax=Methylotenera TaxID=359407 RepID=UPI0003780EF7|nr:MULTISPECIES: hypothetical protein [Methylotenera]